MKSKTGNTALLKTSLVAALQAVGMKEAEIVFSGNKIEIASQAITVSPTLQSGKRLWVAESSYSVMRLEDAFESQVARQLFTVPLDEDLQLARRLATHIAISKIDAALDSVVNAHAGSLRR